MDEMMIEIPLDSFSGAFVKGVEVGDEVVISGSQGNLDISAELMADELETNSYELLCAFGARLPRIYV